MSRVRVPIAVAVGLLVGGLAVRAGAQGAASACTTPLDPACNHLKCYQIKDTATTQKTPIVQLDNQFGREVVFRLQPVLLCVPTQKSCCNASGCSAANCQPNPVPSPALPHFKCYRIKAKECPNNDCTTLAKFAKGTVQVNLRDQFGPEGPLPLGNPVLLCAPADKQVVGQTTTTTNSTTTTVTTTSTTTTTAVSFCHFDSLSNACAGPCPPSAPAGSQCEQIAPGDCQCVLPPVCCECQSGACFNSNGECPTGCSTVPNATCDSTTGQCGCGLCRDPASPTGCTNPGVPCSTSQPCPSNLICDPVHCPAPCDPCAQGTACNPVQCIRTDGTFSRCQAPISGSSSCSCCGPPNGPCLTDADCCSGVCNAAKSCQ
jgi:hypothetical protein